MSRTFWFLVFVLWRSAIVCTFLWAARGIGPTWLGAVLMFGAAYWACDSMAVLYTIARRRARGL